MAYEKGGVEAVIGVVVLEAVGVAKTPLTSLKTMDETGVTSKPVSQIMDVGEVLIAAFWSFTEVPRRVDLGWAFGRVADDTLRYVRHDVRLAGDVVDVLDDPFQLLLEVGDALQVHEKVRVDERHVGLQVLCRLKLNVRVLGSSFRHV